MKIYIGFRLTIHPNAPDFHSFYASFLCLHSKIQYPRPLLLVRKSFFRILGVATQSSHLVFPVERIH